MSTTTDATTLIQPSPMQRDAQRWWTHPGVPDFDEDLRAYRAWIDDQDLEIKYVLLQDEAETHPAYRAYFEDELNDLSAWTVAPPRGKGWFPLSIHDTEDGPVWVWVWARRDATVEGDA